MLTKIQNGSNTYVVYDIEDGIAVDEISVIMINNNQDNAIGLAPIRVESDNGVQKRLLFDITGKISIREYVSRRINQDTFKNMTMSIIDSIENFDEYMIDARQVLLDVDNVYINEINGKVSFICLALKDKEQPCNLCAFFKTVVENSNVSISVNEKDYFHSIWNVIRNENGFSLSNMKAVLTSGVEAATPVNTAVGNSTSRTVPNMGIPQVEQPKSNIPSNVVTTSITDNTVTVMPTQTPVVVQPVQPIETPSATKKSGLFNKLFSSKKSESAQPDPKNISASKSKQSPAKSGLAGWKNGSHSAKAAPVYQVPQEVPATYQPSAPAMPVSTNNAIPQQQSMNVGMNSTVPAPVNSVVNPSSDYGMGTTVLNAHPAQSAVPTPVVPVQVPIVAQTPTPTAIPTQTPVPSTVSAHVPTATPMSVNQADNNLGTTVLNAPPRPSDTKLSLGKSDFDPGNDTTVLVQPSLETTVLTFNNVQSTLSPYIIRRKNNNRVLVKTPLFRIGKERSQVDYFISDNTAISRAHAKIINRNDEYFVVDLKSTNHTFVNGFKIEPDTEVQIKSGDVLRLANEDFEFTLA